MYRLRNVVLIQLPYDVPPEMMNIGMGVYGRSFTLSSPSNHDVGAPTRGAGDSGQFTAYI
jgi:GH18 family chitinase